MVVEELGGVGVVVDDENAHPAVGCAHQTRQTVEIARGLGGPRMDGERDGHRSSAVAAFALDVDVSAVERNDALHNREAEADADAAVFDDDANAALAAERRDADVTPPACISPRSKGSVRRIRARSACAMFHVGEWQPTRSELSKSSCS